MKKNIIFQDKKKTPKRILNNVDAGIIQIVIHLTVYAWLEDRVASSSLHIVFTIMF